MENQENKPEKSLDEVKSFDELYELVDSMNLEQFRNSVWAETITVRDTIEGMTKEFKDSIEYQRQELKSRLLKKGKIEDFIAVLETRIRNYKSPYRNKISDLLRQEGEGFISRN